MIDCMFELNSLCSLKKTKILVALIALLLPQKKDKHKYRERMDKAIDPIPYELSCSLKSKQAFLDSLGEKT